jgi:anti-sigma factor RsiW
VPPRPAEVPPRLVATRPATAGPDGHRGHRLRLKPVDAAAVRPRRRLQSLVGIALLVAAVGAVAQATLGGLGWLSGDRRAAIYRAYLEGGMELDLVTAEPARLSGWLAERLGKPVALPDAPGGFALIGGKAPAEGLPDGAAMAVYASDAGPALLMIEAAKGAAGTAPALAPLVAVEDGLARVEWRDGPHSYALVGALPPDKLALFAD